MKSIIYGLILILILPLIITVITFALRKKVERVDNKMKKKLIILFVFIVLLFSIIIWFIASPHLKGTIVFNDTSCLSSKRVSCAIIFDDDSGISRDVDYAGTSLVYCPSFLSGKVDPDIYNSKKGDRIEVYGLSNPNLFSFSLTLCGSPTYYLRRIYR